ncbi:MAG: hypothetical protein OEU54_00720 [Gemmatimonadota bacterium]|nr:hypothetical protein [Gemmatimonadota bacterium]
MTYRTAGSAALLLAVSLPLSARSAEAQDETRKLLRRVAGASGDDLSRLASGVPLVRVVDTGDESELLMVHAVRMRAPVAFILDQARDSRVLVDDAEGAHARGVFADPPGAADLAGLALERREVRQLERCEVGDCGLKLPAETIERLHRDVDWDSRTAGEDANRFFRREMFAILASYRDNGHEAAPVYADKAEPLHVGEGLEGLLAQAGYLVELDASFHRHLSRYPQVAQSAIEDRFSWTVEDLGVKSVVSLNHVAISPINQAGRALIGVKRLYANHYLQAGLRVILISPATGDPEAADTYVTVVTRLRFDGDLGGLRRTAMERRLERNADQAMVAVRDHLEAAFLQQ